MSFFNRGGSNSPALNSPSIRVPDNHSLSSGPRSGNRVPPPQYNDPSSALFEKRQYDRRSSPAPTRTGSYGVAGCPSDALALSNCLIVHPADFQPGQHVLVKGAYPLTTRHDNTGKLQRGTIGASAMQRQWIGLSLSGDEVTVEPLPYPPSPSAPSYLASLDVEVGFLRRGHEIPEQFSADEMTRNFLKALSGVIFAVDEILVFEFHGQNLKVVVKAVGIVELADEQRRGGARQPRPASHDRMGILMDKTDITFIKSGDSAIKIKSSAKKAPPNAILAPNFKFEDMGIGGLDTEFGEIFRRAFASRVFPPGLVEKLGIEHVKGGEHLNANQLDLTARHPRYSFTRPTGDREIAHCTTNREDAKCT